MSAAQDDDTRDGVWAPRFAPVAQIIPPNVFADMDVNLREMGVGDMSVGKRVRGRWEAFHGRALAYEAALDSADPATLAEALARNVWRGAPPPDDAAGRNRARC